MDLNALKTLGEWMALGFYEAIDEEWPIGYGRAFRRLYENMDIEFPPDALLLPHEPLPQAMTMASHKTWVAQSLICDFNHNGGLCVNALVVEKKKNKYPQHAEFIDELVKDLGSRLVRFGGYTHSNPDIRRIVTEGFDAMEAELDGELETVRADGDNANAGELNLLTALKEYATGVRAFYCRALAVMREGAQQATGKRKAKLALIADSFANCFVKPARTFIEGLLAVNFAWLLDGCDSIGRLDQALGELFENDINDGSLDIAFARELLDELWQKFEIFNSWNLQVGGYTPEGRDGFNALTKECIDACDRNHFRRPNVAFRVTGDTPDSALVGALKVLSEGSGRPALYNDDLYTKTLFSMDLGLTKEDSYEVGFGGCTETMISGLSNVGSLEGTINLAKALELAVYDGFDPINKTQAGPHSGDFCRMKNFDEFAEAVKKQILFMTDSFVVCSREQLTRRFTEGDPKLYRTFFTRDCVKNRKSFEAGGARYNWSVVTYQGIANLIDSMAAVRKVVFEDKTITPGELSRALMSDFRGYEFLRNKLMKAPHYGNGDDYVDELGSEIISYAWQALYAHETPRGGRYLPSCILFTTYGGAGARVGATPDGRRACEALADSVGPVQGRDVAGPTAMLNSVCKLPLFLAVGTPVLNLRFQKSVMKTESDLQKIASLIRAYFAKGGMQIQISVVSRDEMLSAQKEPEKHADLIVRIGGFSEYFTLLGRDLQDSVIARTEHTL